MSKDDERLAQVIVAYLVLCEGIKRQDIATDLGVSVRTVHAWVKQVLEYGSFHGFDFLDSPRITKERKHADTSAGRAAG